MNNSLKPIIKWVGGKSQCVKILSEYIFTQPGTVYIEPFIGGGSVLLTFKPDNFIINDINPNLMCMYNTIKYCVNELRDYLHNLEQEYNNLSTLELKQNLYTHYRKRYNSIKYHDKLFDSNVELSSLFIMLNKLGFNGIYRENSSGIFNVPFGKHQNFNVDYDNLTNVSQYFNNSTCEFYCESYDTLVDKLYKKHKNVMLYLDPPYFVCDESKFVQYTSATFSGEDTHKTLYKNINKWQKNKNWHIVCSNSYCDFTQTQSLGYNLGTRSINLTKNVGRTSAIELLSFTKNSNVWKQYYKYLSGKIKFDSVENEKKYLNLFSRALSFDSKRDKECFNIGKLGEMAVKRIFAEHNIPFDKCPFKENVRPDGFIEINGKQYIVEIKSRTYTCTGTASEKIDCIPRKLYNIYKKYNYHSIVIFVGGQIEEKSGKTFLLNECDYVKNFKNFAKNISGVDYWLSFDELEDWIHTQQS